MKSPPPALVNIQNISPYLPGKPIEELRRELKLSPAVKIIKLASNENPFGASPKSLTAIKKTLTESARYPDGNAFLLKSAIVDKFKKYNLSSEQIVIGNGSNDVLDLAARIFLNSNDVAVFSQYCFAVYPLVTQACNAKAIEVPVLPDFNQDLNAITNAVIRHKAKVAFLANPNNPTGVFNPMNEVLEFIKKIPTSCVIILDEAYTEYLDTQKGEDENISFNWLSQFPNLIITRTFSKIYGLGGLRVGYALAHPQIADFMNRLRQPFNVNHLAITAAVAAISDTVFLEKSKKNNREQLKFLHTSLEKLKLSTMPAFGNFITFKLDKASEVNIQLLKSGIIVRPLKSYGLPDWLRVTVGTADENKKFINSLTKIINKV